MKTAIIIPCYNEEKRLNPEIVISYYDKDRSVNFILVDDGSLDGTSAKLETIAEGRDQRIKVLGLKENVGKAEAVRQGVLTALATWDCDYIGYFDADFSTPLTEIPALLATGKEFILGSRVNLLGRCVRRRWYRHYLGRAFATAVDLLFRFGIYDTQCGAKLVARSLAQEIFARPCHSRWLFDIELIARAQKINSNRKLHEFMTEVPLQQWLDSGNSRIRATDLLRVPFELIKIKILS